MPEEAWPPHLTVLPLPAVMPHVQSAGFVCAVHQLLQTAQCCYACQGPLCSFEHALLHHGAVQALHEGLLHVPHLHSNRPHMIPAAQTSQPTCAIALDSSCAGTGYSPPPRPHPHAPIRSPQALSPAPACPPGTLHHSAAAQLQHSIQDDSQCNSWDTIARTSQHPGCSCHRPQSRIRARQALLTIKTM